MRHKAHGPSEQKRKPSTQRYECLEGNASLVITDKRHKIEVLIDSGSNIILQYQNTARTLKVPYEIRENLLKKTACNGEVSLTGGKYHSHPIQMEMCTNGHMTMVSCEIAEAGNYEMIILLGWWHHEDAIKNIGTP